MVVSRVCTSVQCCEHWREARGFLARANIDLTNPIFDGEAHERIGDLLEQLNAAQSPLESPNEDDVNARRRAEMLHGFQRDPNKCRRYTGELCYDVLELKFKYLNDRGALDRLAYWHGAGTGQSGRRFGRPRLLSTFEAYVLFKMRLRRGEDASLDDLIGVSRSTISRVYHTMLRAVAYILSMHQPWPCAEALHLFTDGVSRSNLGLKDQVVVLKGDATERSVHRPLNALASVVYSDYKARTTVKYNAMILCNGYMVEITRGYAGRTSDNQLHTVDGIPERISSAVSPPGTDYVPVLVFDKGLTGISELYKFNVILMRPYGKDPGQHAWAEADTRQSATIASERAEIELCFGEIRKYKSFDQIFSLQYVVVADLEATVLRCEINMRPPRAANASRRELAARAQSVDASV